MQNQLHKTVWLFFLLFISHHITTAQSFKVSQEPRSAKIITADITNFYKAFDLALKDTTNAKKIFKKEYFSKGTKGLKDFFKLKIEDIDTFTKFVIHHQEFYKSIRKNITNLDDLKRQIYSNFESFKALYPQAVFPDVYFVIGRFTSNGTISKRGLLIGTELISKTSDTNTENWNNDILRICMIRNHIPITVSHELVHFNQDKMKAENTLLFKSLREGSAEFIAELISGKTDGNYSEFKGKELEIWNDFKKDKNKGIWSSWNLWQKSSEKRPRNAGYWTGYIICKAYYNQVKDKKRAISDILNIQNYEDFYKKSKVEAYIKENYN